MPSDLAMRIGTHDGVASGFLARLRRGRVHRLLVLPLVAAGLALPAATSVASATTTDWDPSGVSMPVGDIAGWHQVFADNFANDSYPLGSFTNCGFTGCPGLPNFHWGSAADGHPDTSTNCQYYASQTVSVQNGLLDMWVHTAPNGVCMVANLFPRVPKFTYMMYSVRFRADSVLGYKLVDLLWPVNNTNGEIDYPENQLQNGITGSLHQFAGDQDPTQLQRFTSGISSTAWHTATTVWTPNSLVFMLDGNVIGATATAVPNTPHTFMLRTESALGAAKPTPLVQGHLQIDWVTVYSYDQAPTVTSVTPAVIGSGATNQTITVTGPGFTPDAQVTFNTPGVTAAGPAVLVNPNTLSVPVNIAASTPVGPISLNVTDSAGSGGCSTCFSVGSGPAPASLNVPNVDAHSTAITLDGANFEAGAKITTTAPGVLVKKVTSGTASTLTAPVHVSLLTPPGAYNLTVTNPDGGSATCAGCLVVITPAGPPVIGTATYGNGSAQVNFGAPSTTGGSPITSYTVTAFNFTQPTLSKVTATGAGSPMVVTGLVNGDHYDFRVQANNAAGPSKYSQPSNGFVPRA